MKRLKYLPLILIVGVLTCCFIFGLAEYELGKVRELGGYGDHGLPFLGGDPPPSGGSCSNVGVAYEDNPFSGWPLDYRPGDWSIISAWFCDPDYFEGYTHWGIDLARGNSEESARGHSVLVTTDDAIIEQTSNCLQVGEEMRPGCQNGGMGNYVALQALDCQVLCEKGYLDINEDGVIDPNYCEEVCEETGWFAYHFHLLDVAVAVGQRVERGDVLGRTDNTGRSTGDHLHYQINGPDIGAVDPAPTMTDDYGEGLRDAERWER
jgi:murein DD-endopeptidase MepM/ murein hydrolase activator NlpD